MKIKSELLKTTLTLAGMVAVFAGCVLVPYGLRDARFQKDVDQAREQLGINEVDNAGLVRLYEQVQELRDEMEDRGRYVPDEDQISLVIKDLSQLINAAGVSGQEFVTSKPDYYADYNIMPVKIQFNAPFATAYDLVGQVETLSRVVRIDHLSVTAGPDYPVQPLTVNLELSAFFVNDRQGGDL